MAKLTSTCLLLLFWFIQVWGLAADVILTVSFNFRERRKELDLQMESLKKIEDDLKKSYEEVLGNLTYHSMFYRFYIYMFFDCVLCLCHDRGDYLIFSLVRLYIRKLVSFL